MTQVLGGETCRVQVRQFTMDDKATLSRWGMVALHDDYAFYEITVDREPVAAGGYVARGDVCELWMKARRERLGPRVARCIADVVEYMMYSRPWKTVQMLINPDDAKSVRFARFLGFYPEQSFTIYRRPTE